MDSKLGCLLQKSITSSSSDVSSPTAVAGMTGTDTHDCLAEQSAREEKGKTSFFYSSKRKMTSEISPQVDSAAKRAKQGEMDRVAVRRVDGGEESSAITNV